MSREPRDRRRHAQALRDARPDPVEAMKQRYAADPDAAIALFRDVNPGAPLPDFMRREAPSRLRRG